MADGHREGDIVNNDSKPILLLFMVNCGKKSMEP